MAKKLHLILIALLCLPLIAAAKLPQTLPPGSTDTDNPELIPALSTGSGTDQSVMPNSTGCYAVTINVQNIAFEQELVERVNAERANAGLPPLKLNESLSNASRYHANDMMADVYFNHDTYDVINGSLKLVCNTWDRIKNYYVFDSWAGENIAAGQDTPEAVMSAWMASDGHRANILNPNFREIGVGYYHGGSWFGDFWVQDFGTRSNVYPIVINLESGQTSSRDLSLYLNGKGVFSQYRIRDDSSQWSAWQPFQEHANWYLNGQGNLSHTVTVELRKSNGEVTSSSDSIFLFGQPSLGNLPDSVRFVYIISTGTLTATDNCLQPLNVGSADVLNWSLSTTANWISLSETSGTTPNTQVTVSPLDLNSLNPGQYTGSLTFIVTSPANVAGSPNTIPVSLSVVVSLDNSVFLPAIGR
jgi:uncharacterized protein YkwD